MSFRDGDGLHAPIISTDRVVGEYISVPKEDGLDGLARIGSRHGFAKDVVSWCVLLFQEAIESIDLGTKGSCHDFVFEFDLFGEPPVQSSLADHALAVLVNDVGRQSIGKGCLATLEMFLVHFREF